MISDVICRPLLRGRGPKFFGRVAKGGAQNLGQSFFCYSLGVNKYALEKLGKNKAIHGFCYIAVSVFPAPMNNGFWFFDGAKRIVWEKFPNPLPPSDGPKTFWPSPIFANPLINWTFPCWKMCKITLVLPVDQVCWGPGLNFDAGQALSPVSLRCIVNIIGVYWQNYDLTNWLMNTWDINKYYNCSIKEFYLNNEMSFVILHFKAEKFVQATPNFKLR